MASELIDIERLSAILRAMRENGATYLKCNGVEINLTTEAPAALPTNVTPNALQVANALIAGVSTSSAAPGGPSAITRAGMEKRRKQHEALGLVDLASMSKEAIALASAGTYDPAIDEPKPSPVIGIPEVVEKK